MSRLSGRARAGVRLPPSLGSGLGPRGGRGKVLPPSCSDSRLCVAQEGLSLLDLWGSLDEWFTLSYSAGSRLPKRCSWGEGFSPPRLQAWLSQSCLS